MHGSRVFSNPITYVCMFHSYRSDYDDDKQSERAVTDEGATDAASVHCMCIIMCVFTCTI